MDDSGTRPQAEGPPTGSRRILKVIREWGLPLLLLAVAWPVVGWIRAPDLPEQAPEFVLQDLAGQQVALSDFRGQTVVLNFWAEWCGPCRMEIPAFSKFATNNQDIVVLGLATDGTPRQLVRAAQDLGITYPVLIADRATQAAYGVQSLPTTVVVGPDGEVRSAHAGIMFRPQLAWATR